MADGARDAFKTTSLALESNRNSPGDVPSSTRRRKSWEKWLEIQFTGTNQVERLVGVFISEKYYQAIKKCKLKPYLPFFFFLVLKSVWLLYYFFNFIFKLYNIVLVLPNIEMNPLQVYLCSPFWTLLPPPSPYPSSGSSQCTSPKHPLSCIKPGLATHFIHDILHVSMPFSQISPPSPSPTESIRLIYTSVSLLLSRTQGYCYHLSKFHICISTVLSHFHI